MKRMTVTLTPLDVLSLREAQQPSTLAPAVKRERFAGRKPKTPEEASIMLRIRNARAPSPQEVDAMQAILSELPDPQRKALAGFYANSLSPAEACAHAGISLDTFTELKIAVRSEFFRRTHRLAKI